MSGHKICSREDCPTSNTTKEYTTKCGKCGNELHLPCVGINGKVNDVLFHPCIRVFCSECSRKSDVGSNKLAAAAKLKQTSLELSSVLDILRDVQHVVRDTNTKVTSNVASSVTSTQSYAAVLKKMDEVKELTAKTNDKLSASRVVATRRMDFPLLGAQSPNGKRMRNDNENIEPMLPKKIIGRKLLSGTSSESGHGLGVAVVTKERPNRSSSFINFKKSIYVTKLPTDITVEALTEYIKKRIENVNENEFLLRMLVKKDADLSEKTFLSCRLACTDALYDKFMDPSFWPSHVMIGEFIDTPRPQRPIASVTDFMAKPIIERNVNATKPPAKNDPDSVEMVDLDEK